MSSSEKIARAYGVLVTRGDKLTVRGVQREAGVRIGEVAAWMREHAAGATGDVPEAPDLSEAMAAMVQAVWAAAWKRAAKQAHEATAVALDAARTGEADALGAAEKDAAVTARDRVPDEAQQLRRQVGQLRAQLDTAHPELDQARAQVEQADRARVRAEASSDTLREVLDTLRADGRGSATAKH